MEQRMNLPTFEAFERRALADGASSVLERRWAPETVVDTHTHPFRAQVLVVQGELWLTVGQDVRHVQAGDSFDLAAGVPHAERYGSDGATFWVARS